MEPPSPSIPHRSQNALSMGSVLNSPIARVLWMCVLVVLLDGLSKWGVHQALAYGESWPIWPDVLHISHTRNTGMAFGLWSQSPQVVITISGLAWLGGVAWVCLQYRQWLSQVSPGMGNWGAIALGSVLGGALANWLERLLHGYVTDFIDVTLIQFAVFNVADMAVCMGVAVLLLLAWRMPAPAQNTEQQSSVAGKNLS